MLASGPARVGAARWLLCVLSGLRRGRRLRLLLAAIRRRRRRRGARRMRIRVRVTAARLHRRARRPGGCAMRTDMRRSATILDRVPLSGRGFAGRGGGRVPAAGFDAGIAGVGRRDTGAVLGPCFRSGPIVSFGFATGVLARARRAEIVSGRRLGSDHRGRRRALGLLLPAAAADRDEPRRHRGDGRGQQPPRMRGGRRGTWCPAGRNLTFVSSRPQPSPRPPGTAPLP